MRGADPEDLRRLRGGAQADMRLLLAELRPRPYGEDWAPVTRGWECAGRPDDIPISVTAVGDGNLPADVKVASTACARKGRDILPNMPVPAGWISSSTRDAWR